MKLINDGWQKENIVPKYCADYAIACRRSLPIAQRVDINEYKNGHQYY
jgi:hypothetical protein